MGILAAWLLVASLPQPSNYWRASNSVAATLSALSDGEQAQLLRALACERSEGDSLLRAACYDAVALPARRLADEPAP